MPKPRRPETVAVSKSDKRHLLRYLEYEDPNHIQISLRDVRWQPTHGETRSASKRTFHIGVRFVQGEHQTCVIAKTDEGELPVDDTVRNWVQKSDQPGHYFYYDEKDDFHECDAEGNDIYISYKNSRPQWTTGKIGSQSSGEERRYEERRYEERGYGGREHGGREHGGRAERGYAEKGYGERRHAEREYVHSSQKTYLTDPHTGKLYYIDGSGKSRWA